MEQPHLEAKAPNSSSLSRALFTLNPGMAVSAVRVGGASASFTHEDGLLDIALPRPFAPGEVFTIEVEADGVPDENFAYVDAAKDPFSGTFQENQSLFILGQATLIFERGHVALLPGIAWLPLSGPYAATGDPSVRPDDRYTTRLEVDVPEDLLVAGPGARRDVAGAPSGMKRYLFDAKAPMPAPALVAGRFESRKATIDGVAVELLVDRKHTKNLEVFAPAADAIEKKIAEKLERARAWGLTYPYDGFTLVEVPTRLRGYGGGWRMDSTFSPPAMVLMREAGFPTASFFRRFRDPKKWEDADGGVEGEMVRHLERFFSLDFTGGNLLMGASRAFGAHQIAGSGKDGLALEFVVDTLIAELVFETRGFFSAFLFDSDLNATIGSTIVGFLSSNQEESVTDIVLRTTADRPSVWDALLGTSLSAIDPASDPGRTVTVLNVKARALAQTMLQAYGRENTARALVELIRARRGQTFDRTHLNEALRSVGIEPGTLLSDWLDTTEIPGFVTSDATVTRLIDGPDGQARYQLLVHIHNAGSAVGVAVVKATARSEESRQSFSSDPVRVAAGESVEIGVTMSVPPTEVRLEPLFSQNRGPFSIRFSPVDEDAPRGTEEPLAGVRASEWRPRDDGSIVIDDLDPAFEPKATPVPTLLDSVRAMGARKKDDVERDLGLEVHPSFAPLTLQEWRRISAGSAWGRFRRTMAIAPAGTGEVEAIFRADVPSSGRYRIEIHVPSRQTLGPALQQMKYGAWTIKVDDGTGGEALRFDADAAIGGWNEVGVVPIKGGAVTVSYGNKLDNGGQLLVADAIRLVPVTRAAGGTP
ncbi:MAG: hypothetical protein HC882_08405 [Acidobacteria bacterium]|nr:hypothetical protein [Acidobacteriota bacterium]